MRLFGGLSLVALLTASAGAQDGASVINQHADGAQVAENRIDLGSLESLTDAYMREMMNFTASGSLSQASGNTVNSITGGGNLGRVVQRFDGIQSSNNSLALAGMDIHGSLSQVGNNVAGIVLANRLEFADQLFSASGRQFVENQTEVAALLGSVEQSGINTANFAQATVAIGSATQTIALGAVQQIDNRLEVAAMSAVSAAITQHGENFGNILISDTIDMVSRNFAGDQIIHNTIVLGDGQPGQIKQHGSNVANFIMASHVGTIEQTSKGTQSVVNEVLDSYNNLIKGDGVIQTMENSVNMVLLTTPTDSGDDGTISVSQDADFTQSSSGSGPTTQTGNAVVINR